MRNKVPQKMSIGEHISEIEFRLALIYFKYRSFILPNQKCY